MTKTTSILGELTGLRKLKTGELRERYQQVFGEPTASRNREYLFKKIAAAVQERAAKAEAQIGANAPIDATPSARRIARAKGEMRDPRLPAVGASLERDYKGKKVRVKVLADGFEYRGQRYTSLSAIALVATGTVWNGFLFFKESLNARE